MQRCLSSYKNNSERFILQGRKFNLQYSQLYAVRIMALRKKLAVAVRKKWGEYAVSDIRSRGGNVTLHIGDVTYR